MKRDMVKGIALGVGLSVAALIVGMTLVVVVLGSDDDVPAGALHTTGLLHVNVNVSDFERSRKFYERLGFTEVMKVEKTEGPDVAAAVGMQSYIVKGALFAHKNGAVIDLLEWKDPVDSHPPYANMNHIGIARIALTTTDLDADVALLKAEGVEFLSESAAEVSDGIGGVSRFILFKDPDGTVLEFVEMGTIMGAVQQATTRMTSGP